MQIEAIAKQIQWERSSKPRRVRLTVVQLSPWNLFFLLRSGGTTPLRRQRSIFVVRKLWRGLCHECCCTCTRSHRTATTHLTDCPRFSWTASTRTTPCLPDSLPQVERRGLRVPQRYKEPRTRSHAFSRPDLTWLEKSREFVCNVTSSDPGESCNGARCTCARSGVVNSRLKSQLSVRFG